MNFDLATVAGSRAAILVEGMSDQAALEALAERRGLALDAQGISIVQMGGATNIDRFLSLLGPRGLDVRLAGLCDAAEEGYFRRALQRAGFGSGPSLADPSRADPSRADPSRADPSRADMEALGFYVCAADLEDELIRALGAASVEEIIRAQGEIRSWRTFQKQPAQQGQSRQMQLHRFMGTRSGRKSQYARLLAFALDPARVPRPLDRVLAHV
jgi:OLD-like protein